MVLHLTIKPLILTLTIIRTAKVLPFLLKTVGIVGNTLALSIEYSGGCKKEHTFTLYSKAEYAESEPEQLTLYLNHNSNGDACEKLMEKKVFYDLTSIQLTGKHKLIVRIKGYEESLEYEY